MRGGGRGADPGGPWGGRTRSGVPGGAGPGPGGAAHRASRFGQNLRDVHVSFAERRCSMLGRQQTLSALAQAISVHSKTQVNGPCICQRPKLLVDSSPQVNSTFLGKAFQSKLASCNVGAGARLTGVLVTWHADAGPSARASESLAPATVTQPQSSLTGSGLQVRPPGSA